MAPLSAEWPKPLLPVLNRPVIDHQLALMRSVGVREVVVVVKEGAAELHAHLGDGAAHGVPIRYAEQTAPQGIAHAVLAAEPLVGDRASLLMLGDIYFGLLQAYHGDALDYDEDSRLTWARIPHFFSTPYYVYQYATCFASSAQLIKQMSGSGSTAASRADAVRRYLDLLRAGGSDHPMTLLQQAGVDLSKPEAVQAVVEQLDTLVTELEKSV